MLQSLKLLLPAIIPSWSFFDEIGQAPTVEFTLLQKMDDEPASWQEFRPRPDHLSAMDMLKRLFWNARWNESLFLVSCAERLMENPTVHSENEIFTRIKADLQRNSIQSPYMQFRLSFRIRHGDSVQKDILFTSPVHAL